VGRTCIEYNFPSGVLTTIVEDLQREKLHHETDLVLKNTTAIEMNIAAYLLDFRAQLPSGVSTKAACRSRARLCEALVKKKSLCFVPDNSGV
jgi:hypothetical protein